MDTRERLVESARALLWERGYVGTSPKAIQRHAGVGQGSMYHHFTGKPELALAAVRRTASEMRATAASELDGPGTASDRVMAYLRRSREVLRGCPIGRMTHDPDVVTDPLLRQPLAETFEWLRGRLAEILAPELPDGVSALAVAATVLATLQGGYVLARAAGDAEPFDRAIDGIEALLTTLMGD
jgi:TetR/AcrR family transcriptional repressor of nem operon